MFPFSVDLQTYVATGFWYDIPQPYFIWVWGVQVGVSVVSGKTSIYTVLYNTTDLKRVFPTFAHFTTINLEAQTITIQASTTSIPGSTFVYDYTDGSLWSISSSSLSKLDISNPSITTSTTIYSGFVGVANGVLDLQNQKFYTLALGVWDTAIFQVYDLVTKNVSTFLLGDGPIDLVNLSLIQ